MTIVLLITALLPILLISLSNKRSKFFFFSLLFFLSQAFLSVYILLNFHQFEGKEFYVFFVFDKLSALIFSAISVVSFLSVISSYYDVLSESVRNQKLYYISFIALDIMLLGVIFSNNIVVTWILLEATTLFVAILSYHNHNSTAVEATWKYIFISSVGIALAYFGILLLGYGSSDLSYPALRTAVTSMSPIMLKIAFILIFIGYSSKLEVIPLHTPSIDVNHSAPSSASGFISSALVGAAFVSLLRLYNVYEQNSEVFSWVKNVLLLVGLLSMFVTAVYVGRTDNLKRLLSYSTVENSALTMLGLGIGGIGYAISIIHMTFHMILKCIAFLQLTFIGKIYGSYKIGMQFRYFRINPLGAAVFIIAILSLLAFPPSILFRTEISFFYAMISSNLWWMVVILMIFLLLIIYWMFEKILPVLYKKDMDNQFADSEVSTKINVFSFILLIILFTLSITGWLYFDTLISFFSNVG